MNSLVLLARPKGLVCLATRAASAATAQNPVQRLFVDKVREFKNNNQGLDDAHKKAMSEEMNRLKRVYNVEDENKLSHLDHKFPAECQVSLRDIDESKELRKSIASGEYQRSTAVELVEKSEHLEAVPEQVIEDMHLPPMNKPKEHIILDSIGVPKPLEIGGFQPDYVGSLEPMTPESLQRELRVRFGPNMPTIHDDEAPERDVVNFPRQPQLLDAPPTRHHIIPESWFNFFYPKTGASGLYTFAFSLGTFLFSKEWLIYEHEMIGAISCITICTFVVTKYGPSVKKYLLDLQQKDIDAWDRWQHGTIESLGKIQEHYRGQLDKPKLVDYLYQIREHDINLQLEGEYRNRLKSIHDDVRRRLNYLVSVADSQRQIAHKNMVNWVISNAVSSFGPKQEAEVLDNCILNLKQLSAKNANAI